MTVLWKKRMILEHLQGDRYCLRDGPTIIDQLRREDLVSLASALRKELRPPKKQQSNSNGDGPDEEEEGEGGRSESEE